MWDLSSPEAPISDVGGVHSEALLCLSAAAGDSGKGQCSGAAVKAPIFDVGCVHSDVGVVHSDVGCVHSDVECVHSDVGGVHSDVGGLHSDVGGVHSDVGGVHSDVGGVHSEALLRLSAAAGDSGKGQCSGAAVKAPISDVGGLYSDVGGVHSDVGCMHSDVGGVHYEALLCLSAAAGDSGKGQCINSEALAKPCSHFKALAKISVFTLKPCQSLAVTLKP